MPQSSQQFVSFLAVVASGSLVTWGYGFAPAIAQIIPDGTLGAESSVVNNDLLTEAGLVDLINGGALRDSFLFHSFLDFNVNEGQRVYFANPAVVESIFGRVTGGSPSDILGTLGVLGDADLVLMNPSGIVFGPNAELDIRGSFLASTTDALTFGNGYTFSAVDPTAPPLLTVNSPLGLANWLPPTTGAIANAGNLTVGQDLTLTAHTLDVAGQLRAGGDLTLVATDRLIASDLSTIPFIASAGGELSLQGNQTLSIFALNHPDSGLFSGGNLILISDQAITGDAHYFAGGDFLVEQLDGSPGTLTSPNDPVVRASGDVSFASYTGASLHILAGGSVAIGDVIITGPDTLSNSFQEQITLSDGITVVDIDGNAEPTLDIRAGTLGFGTAGLTPATPSGFVPGIPSTNGNPSSAEVTIGAIANPSGLVFITNQYQPNPALTGDIAVGSIDTTADPTTGLSGGSVLIDSRGQLTFNSINVSGGDFATLPFPGFNFPDFSTLNIGGDSGNVTLLAEGTVSLPFPSTIYAYGLRGGDITIESGTGITQENAPFGFPPPALSWIESNTLFAPEGGDVRLTAPDLAIGGNVLASNLGAGRGGDVVLTSDALVTNQATIATQLLGSGTAGDTIINTNTLLHTPFSSISSANFSPEGGQGGNVIVNAESLVAEGGAQIASIAFAFGDAGDVTISAQDISLSGFTPEELVGGGFFPTTITSTAQPMSLGNSGNVSITTETLSLREGAAIATAAFGTGNAGDIVIDASEFIEVDGAVFLPIANTAQATAINSELFTGASGQGGDIVINTPVLNVTNGGTVTAVTDGDGEAGSIAINASESVLVDGAVSFTDVGQRDRLSQIAVFTATNSTGNGGLLTLTAPRLTLTNSGQLTAETQGVGDAGSIKVNVSDAIVIDGTGSGILSNTSPDATGQGGNIIIDPQLVLIRNGGRIAVDSQGTGAGGDILVIADQLQLDQGLITAETVSADGGNITLRIGDVIVLRDGSRISTSAGTAQAGGDGGNIDARTVYLIATPDENNDITANAFFGSGGRVLITAEGIFGLTPRSRAELEQLLGTGDPAQLDPANLSSSDITAISQANPELNGQVVLASPDTDPNQGAIALPDNIVDASRLIAQGCSSGSIAAQEIGSLVVTGRGGLPADPTEVLSDRQLLLEWATAATGPDGATDPPVLLPAAESVAPSLQEVQSLTVNADGQVVLLAQGGATAASGQGLPVLNCAGQVQEN